MKIVEVSVVWVRVPLKAPYSVRRNEYVASDHVVVRMRTDSGLEGIAETPGYAKPDVMCLLIGNYLGPAVLGCDPRQPELLHQRMAQAVSGHESSKNALDIAAFDISGKAAGMSVAAMLGGQYRESVPVADVLGLVSVEDAARLSQEMQAAGYSQVKLKGGRDFRRDVRVVTSVREACGPDFEIRLDLNAGYETAAQAIPRCLTLQEAGVDILEQPLPGPDLDGMAELTRTLDIPILAHESLATIADAWRIISKRAADILNVSPPKAGGLYPATQIVALAELHNVPVMIAGAMECGPGNVAAAHLGARCRSQPYAGDARTVLRNTHSLVNETIDIHDGRCWLPPGPGLGVSLDMDAIDEFKKNEWVVAGSRKD